MWRYIRNIVTGLLLSTVLLASLGVSYSKISCAKGQQFFLGLETPQCTKEIKQCCHKKKETSNKQSKKKDNRKKKTFHLKINFVTYLEETLEQDIVDPLRSTVIGVEKLYLSYLAQHHLVQNKGNPPPLLTYPTNSFLQTFLI